MSQYSRYPVITQGTVTSVTAVSPLVSSGGSTPQLSLNTAILFASPALTGVPTAPTAGVGTSTTQIATTAFVLSQGFLGATGSMPFAHQSSTTAQTSATTTYVTAISTTITVTASSAPVHAIATGTLTTTTAASVAKYRVSINGVAGQEQLVTLTALATNYDVGVQYLSAALGPGTYTILFEIARNSGTGTVNFFEGTLDAIALQGTSANGITQITGLGLSVGPGSGAQSFTGTLSLAGGGSNASLVAANGAVAYSTATALALTAVGSSGQLLRSAGAGAPTWTTATFPATTTINQLLYSSAANVISGLATVNTGALVTSSTGVPSLASGSTANRVLRTNGTTVSFAQLNLATDVVAVASQRVPFGNGTGLVTDANFIYDTTNQRLSVGGSGTATINAVVTSGTKTALQAYNQSGGNAFQSTNVSAWTAALISRQANATTGASLSMEFGRGTPAAPTGALNGDQIGVIAALPDAADGNAYGYAGAIAFVAAETPTTIATGGDIVMATTPIGSVAPVESLRLKSSGEAVFQKAIATANYTTVAKNALVPSKGWVVFDTTLNQLSYYNGTTWINV